MRSDLSRKGRGNALRACAHLDINRPLIEFLIMVEAFTRFADDLRRTAFFTACIDVARRILPARR
jgi:hypothetical protein